MILRTVFSAFVLIGLISAFVSCIKFPPPLPEQKQEYLLPKVTRIETDQSVDIALKEEQQIQKKKPEFQINPLILDPNNPYYCSNKRLDTAIKYLENGKNYLKTYYSNRNLSYLFFAWYSSEDSVYLVNTVKNCNYKKNMHFYAVRKLQRLNVYLQKDIVRNMREGEYKELGELYMNEYREIFPRDIN